MVNGRKEATARRRRTTRDDPPERVWWSMAECAEAWSVTVQVVRDRLRACNAAQKMGRLWYTSRGLLKHAFPKDWPDMVARLPQ
jgi:hypothetical protein